MNNIPFDDVLIDDFLTDPEGDDHGTDELFSQLGQCEPPIDMVANIMHAISQLPLLKPLSTWKAFNVFEVYFDESQLC
jgi:hypothetical protein